MVKLAHVYPRGEDSNGVIAFDTVTEGWVWHCKTCDEKGEPANFTEAYDGGAAHVKECEKPW